MAVAKDRITSLSSPWPASAVGRCNLAADCGAIVSPARLHNGAKV